ncbi:MAG TPA: DUF6174 domain-containing protein [Gammaproteobacteria bacterium]
MKIRTVVPRSFAIAAAALSAAAPGAADEILDANRALWDAASISTYEYRYRKVCDCHRDEPADTIVAVRDGKVVNVHYERDDYVSEMPVDPAEYRWFRTIADLFSLVATAEANAETLRVRYDETLGYPVYLYVDYDHSLIGDEVELEVVDVKFMD